MYKHKFSYFIIVSLWSLTAFFGCSVYQNVTSYFNTYYNAQKLFDDAVVDLEKAARADKDTNYFAQPTGSSGGQSKFDKVIEKCSKLIQYYPESNLVDDAILLIGKSGVYIGESELAIRKFAELFQNFPESDLLNEAKLWNAKALYFSNKYDDALKIVNELYPEAVKEGENDIAIEAQMLGAQIFFKQRLYPQVVDYLENAVELSGSDKLLRVAQFQLAISLERLGEYEKAAVAYHRVLDYTPDFNVSFRSKLRSGIMQYQSNQPETALETFQSLNEDVLKPEEQALVDHEVANVYAVMDDSLRAFDLYEYIDTTYKRTDAAARSYYRQGVLMEERYGNFKKANDYYNKAKGENPTSEITPLAVKRSTYIARYFAVRSEIKSCDSLFHYLLNEDSIKQAQAKKEMAEDSVKKANAVLARDSARLASDSLVALGQDSVSMIGKISEESGGGQTEVKPVSEGEGGIALMEQSKEGVATPLVTDKAEENPGSSQSEVDMTVQESKEEGKPHPEGGEESRQPPKEFGERPSMNRNAFPVEFGTIEQQRSRHRDEEEELLEEQRISGVESPDMTSGTPNGEHRTAKSQPRSEQTPSGTVAVAPVASGMTFDSLYNLQARKYYELGTLFMTEMNMLDSAEALFNKVLAEFPASTFIPRVLYTLAEVYQEREDTCGTDSLYRIIHNDYRHTEYAKHLNKYFGVTEETLKTIDTLEVQYASINVFPDTSHALESIGKLQQFIESYPLSRYSVKALYAIGWIYENILVNNDSAASVYKKLVDTYPQSEYAAVAKPKVAVKDNPDNLNQYVHVKEIQAVPKPVKPDHKKGTGKENEEEREKDNSFRDRFRDRNANDNQDDEQLQDEDNTDENTDENTDPNQDDNTEDKSTEDPEPPGMF